MATGGDPALFLEAFNYWDEYLTPPPPPGAPARQAMTLAAAMANYNSTYAVPGSTAPLTTTAVFPAAVLRRRKRRLPPIAAPRRAKPTQNYNLMFTRRAYEPVGAPGPGAPGGGPTGSARNWRFVKLLGQGVGPPVALWEYNGPLPGPVINKIAVKNSPTPPNNDLPIEGAHLGMLTIAPTEHIVQLYVNPPDMLTPAECAAQGLDPLIWNTAVRRLIMEYCPQGSLQRLLNYRIGRRLPFPELTLWRIFECLIDGLAVMEFDGEITTSAGVLVPPAAFNPADNMVVHFDLKPPNIFGINRTNAGGTHPFTPIWKLGDFGLAQDLSRDKHNVSVASGGLGWTGPALYSQLHSEMRRHGTKGYFPPEQFSPRWHYRDYRDSTVCGKYGPWSNIWSIAAVMYQLACLDEGTPEPYWPFNPAALPGGQAFPIRGAPALGITYGTKLRITPYSAALKDFIHECLYEEPANRPTILTLKAHVLAGIAACAGQAVEGWQDLDMPEPKTP
ncbi:uncharacterized protein RSE6_07259 [Rhynchosporium secalis]|uniref:non-specific serine/threonine protein kinase n=1 Tax=Rhynchosporium secalis TaxID=38038 RepID=A0A1E1MCD3_RHYSE|nr:uncharacterized protein RSE6_07259 [Rhynchosporium secalis]